MDKDTRREWWKGELAAAALVISLLGMAGSTLNLSMTVGQFVENTNLRFTQIEDYIVRDRESQVTQLEKGYLIEKIARNTAELKDCRVNTRKELKVLHRKMDELLKQGHKHGNGTL